MLKLISQFQLIHQNSSELSLCVCGSCSVISNSLRPHGLYSLWNSPGQNTGMGSRSLLQGIFPTEGSKPGLLHCRQFLYHLSHQGSPRILEKTIPSPAELLDPELNLLLSNS